MRNAEYSRATSETKIELSLILDGAGSGDIKTGCGFLNHMLELFCRHGNFDLKVSCEGDFEVDFHHTVEDVGIVLGCAFYEALGDCRGIRRYGWTALPMDESLVMVAVDISGRGGYYDDLSFSVCSIGNFDTQLVAEFFSAFCRSAGITLHIKKLAGINAHHLAEAAFKGFARSLKEAVSIDTGSIGVIPSTKETIF